MYKKYKTRIKFIMSNKNIKPMHLIILCVTFIFFLCGFSFLTSALNINVIAKYSIYPRTLKISSNLEFRNSTYLSNIKTITFNNTINTPGSVIASWDVSDIGDGSVIAYIVKNSSDNTKYDLYIEANGEINANIDSSSLFSEMTSLTTVNNINILNTSKVTNMSSMFYNCTSLNNLDISKFDSSNVTNMSNMFTNVTGTIIIPKKTGDNKNTTSKYYGKTTSIYASGTFSLPAPPVSFSSDSWNTIIEAAKTGDVDKYQVGDTKCVHVEGFSTTNDNGCNGDFKVRIANMSTSSECSGSNFSQTACGFVIEFEDIITKHIMNSTDTNVDGWPSASMRTYVNNDIYNALPSNLKSAIISTKVISGHGSTSGETNFTSTDKLYLLSTHEVYTDGTSNKVSNADTAYNNTRQLDYYAGLGVTTSSYSGAIKKNNGSNNWWWLRSAFSNYASSFLCVNNNGDWNSVNAYSNSGVSPAFRIEFNPKPESFENDSWSKIKEKINNGTASSIYHVGDTKCVSIDGFSTTNNNDCDGDFKVRIANMSTPSECSGSNFSKTACGFVVEFQDIISEHEMNSNMTNVGGWPATSMRTYANSTIFNALPSDLQSVIINTNVISSHGPTSGETNFTSIDKLYLLSTHEVWEDADGNINGGVNYYDTSYNNTRQLDYYRGLGATTSSYSGAKKQYDGKNSWWWLRSADSGEDWLFSLVSNSGGYSFDDPTSNTTGFSPAFRIG